MFSGKSALEMRAVDINEIQEFFKLLVVSPEGSASRSLCALLIVFRTHPVGVRSDKMRNVESTHPLMSCDRVAQDCRV
jgi:hypothetical protein